MSLLDNFSAWSRLALDLPRFHAPLGAGECAEFLGRRAELPALATEGLAALSEPDAEGLGLDVFMVEAMGRRHGLAPAAVVDDAAQAIATRLGCEPILSYPFYIRLNPTDLAETRRFTPTEAEFRFIRMHRLIEDAFDALIVTLDAVIGAAEPHRALAGAFGGIAEAFRRVNRTVAGFRDPTRMPHADFYDGFRPYFGPRTLADGRMIEGPSGLQSPTFRMVGMLLGYRDAILDGWTQRIGHYHRPATRAALEAVQAARDAGHSLAPLADDLLGPGAPLPHLHPAYGQHLPDLLAIARRERYLTPDVAEILVEYGISLGVWPDGAPALPALPGERPPLPSLNPDLLADLERLAQIEAMFLAFHVEHVAIAAVQIGYERGTGGTSGVEFLLLATFRRAFPALWQSSLGRRFAT